MLLQPIADTSHRPFIRPKKHHSDPTALSLTDLRSKFDEQRLNITPLDIGAYWTGKDSS